MRSTLARLVIALLVLGNLALADVPAQAWESRTVRLEAGPQTGYQFSATGDILTSETVTVGTNPREATADLRHVVPGRGGFYLRLASGALAGYEVLESPVAYIPGVAGRTGLEPPATVRLPVGRYLGYVFDADWGLASTVHGTVSSASTATATRRAVIDGRPYVLLTSGHWAGSWMPTTTPRGLTASRIACAVPAKPPAGSSVSAQPDPHGRTRARADLRHGWATHPALRIMERLVLDRVCATVNPTGDAALTDTGTAVMAVVQAYPELFEVGNHTMHHCNLRDGGGGAACPDAPPTSTRIQAELTDAEAVIGDLTGLEGKPYWRPPYGAYDTRVRDAAAAIGYSKTLMWDVDTIDWKRIPDGGPRTAAMVAKVVANASRGSIVLMHLGGYHTYDALPSMVLQLRAAGLRPTTVSDLLQ